MNKIIIIFLIVWTSTAANAQNVNEKNALVFPNNIVENIVVHTDRDVYLIGEKIFFTAYYSNSQKDSIANLSNVVYIEVFNSNKSFIKRKFKISDGLASGFIEIPLGLLSGNYYIRAYTQYMRNSLVESFYSSLISIINPSVAITNNDQKQSAADIEILPENGNIIQGIPTKVAIKIHPEIRLKLSSIAVIDQSQNILKQPILSKEGHGLFEFTPKSQEHYFLKLMLNDLDSIIKPFPQTVSEGFGIKTTFQKNYEDIIKIDFIKKNQDKEKVHLIIRSKQFEKLMDDTISLDEETTSVSYAAKMLNDGINYLIVRDHNNEIKIIQAFYKHTEAPVEIKINSQTAIFHQRKLVELNIEPQLLNPKEYSKLSVTVAKKGTLTPRINPFALTNNEHFLRSILSNCNKYSLNKQAIESLVIFYNKTLNTPEVSQHLFNESPKEINWVPEIRDVSISGIVRDKASKLPIKDIQVYASVFKKNPQFHIYKTDEHGKFIFSINNLVNDQYVFLCTKTKNEQALELFINNDFSNRFPDLIDPALMIDSSDRTFLNEMIINFQTAQSFKTEATLTYEPALNLPYNFDFPDFSIKLSDYVKIETLKTIFKELMPGVRLKNKKNNYSLSILDKENNRFFDEDPLVIIDNITIFDINELLKIPTSKIKNIDVFNTSFVSGEHIINGLVVITTNTDNFGGIEIPIGSSFLNYQTISPSVTIESTEYDTEEKKASRLADFRNLLYWNPQISTSGKTNVSFYTSDHCSEYEIIVKGFTSEGRECFGKTSFKVVAE